MVQPTTTHDAHDETSRLAAVTRLLQADSSTPDWSRALMRIGPRIIAGLGLALIVLMIGLLAFRVMFDDKIYPAVVVGDVDVGGLTLAQAQEQLDDRASALNLSSITFTYGDQTWTPTLGEIGATIQTDMSLREAHALGREDDAVTRLAFTGNIIRADQTVPLKTSLDLQKLDAWFDTVDADIGNPAIDAGIVVNGTDVTFTPDSTGIVVDREAAKSQIMDVLRTLQPIDADLPTLVDEPAIRVADLDAARGQVESILAKPVRIEFEDQSWRLEAATVSQFMTVKTKMVDGQAVAEVDFNRDALGSFLRETYSGEINRAPVDATVGWDGGLYAKSTSVDGAAVMTNEFANAIAESFLGGHDRVAVPVHVTKPQVDSNNLDALKIDTMLGRGDSNFGGGSAERDQNIYTGVEAVNGVLVPPGEDFSFNGAIGAITEEAGYVESGVILGEDVGRDVGGGICQVSTTVFRAALMGGFPMTEWHPHSYRLLGYEHDGWGPGFDASILQLGDNPSQWADFRFKNTTDGWILVQSWTSYPYHVVEIFGHDMGWDVNISDVWVSDPVKGKDKEVVDSKLPPGSIVPYASPSDGLRVGYTRTVHDANGELIGERWFETNFLARGVQWNVSPDMVGESPGAGN